MSRARIVAAAVAALTAVAALPACSVIGGGGGTYEVVAYFDRAVSVYPSSDVRVLGLAAGSVKDVEVEGDRVKITLSVNEDVPIPEEVNAALIPRSLIGERYVQLFPVWKDGDPRASDGHVIDLDHTQVPVEPDEALAAVDEFLRDLDPDGLGSLIDNLADDLDGQGETLNSALGELSQLVSTFADADEDLLSIIDHFDDFTATLTTRESQLADVLDSFATATDVLADERRDIETLLSGLAKVSVDGLDLLTEHAAALRTDIETLTFVTQSVDANLGAVEDLLSSGPRLIAGIQAAYNPDLRAINLRQSFAPVIPDILNQALEDLLGPGLPPICIPIPDTACPDAIELAGSDAVPASIARPTTPIDSILAVLDVPDVRSSERPETEHRSLLEQIASVFTGVGG